MEKTIITNAVYLYSDLSGRATSIRCDWAGKTIVVPMDVDNRHYKEILDEIDNGRLVVAEGNEPEVIND